MCLWSETDRNALRKKAEAYAAIGVVGCESAVLTAERAVPNKPIVPLAKTVGIANYTLRSRFFLTVEFVEGAVVRTYQNEPAAVTSP